MKEILAQLPKNPKGVLILGEGGHGKTTFAKALCEASGLRYLDSSEVALDTVIMPALEAMGAYKWNERDRGYAERRPWRVLWGELILRYNTPDPARLARDVLMDAGVYVGMRRFEEFRACMIESLFDVIFWVDAGERVTKEDPSMGMSIFPVRYCYFRSIPLVVIDSSKGVGEWTIKDVF